MVGGVRMRQVWLVVESDVWCAMFLSMPPSLSCVEMRRRRIGFRACIRCTSHGAPWREGRS